ncbi:MAG: MarR family transcriptional regulator [Alphaproteobacteria bacterium]|nr:MarR family transcriptional regulator [Alphaproteobacteria bacterium]
MTELPNKSEVLKLGNQLCFPLYACAKEVIKIYRKPLEKIGLTYTQYIVMMVLWKFGNMSEKKLGEKIYLDSGTLTPVLKKLEKSGFVKRQRVAEDERFVKIILTDNGVKLKQKALTVPQALEGNIYLSYDEMTKLYDLLNKALEGINKRRKVNDESNDN